MDTKQMANVYKALSNDNRLEIFLSILKNDSKRYETGCSCCVSDILDHLRIGPPTISHHLKELSNAGLITTAKEGKYLVAHVNQKMLEELKKTFDNPLE